jgi:glycosyltransferase involved in cell wall biosynthesis
MKVSIIIRAYNRGYIIGEAIGSALSQTYHNYEILIVDDGSTDNTRQVVEGFPSERIRYISHKKNLGVGAACNTGISAATGDLVAFLDSDDLWNPDYLERQVAFLLAHPEVGAVFTDVKILEAFHSIPSLVALLHHFPRMLGDRQQAKEYIFSGRQMYLSLLEELPIKPSALVVKRDMLGKVGSFDEVCRSGEDWEFLLRLSQLSRFGYRDVPLVVQRRTPDAAHLIWLEQDKSFLMGLFSREKNRLGGDPEALNAVRLGIASHCKNLAWHYLQSGKRWRSVTTYLKGFKETNDIGMILRAFMVICHFK